jgi:microcystin-dependent protein
VSTPYIGEIRMFGGNFAPAGWAFCDGSPMPISENDALFTLIGTTYGGDGETTFNLPNLGGRIPVCAGTNPGTGTTYTYGEMAGSESVTLTTQQMPLHTHSAFGSVDPATSNSPQNTIPASLPVAAGQTPYGADPPPAGLLAASIAPAGGSQPHDNMQPYLVVSFIISLFGIFPTQS